MTQIAQSNTFHPFERFNYSPLDSSVNVDGSNPTTFTTSKSTHQSEWAAKAEKTQAQKIWRSHPPDDGSLDRQALLSASEPDTPSEPVSTSRLGSFSRVMGAGTGTSSHQASDMVGRSMHGQLSGARQSAQRLASYSTNELPSNHNASQPSTGTFIKGVPSKLSEALPGANLFKRAAFESEPTQRTKLDGRPTNNKLQISSHHDLPPNAHGVSLGVNSLTNTTSPPMRSSLQPDSGAFKSELFDMRNPQEPLDTGYPFEPSGWQHLEKDHSCAPWEAFDYESMMDARDEHERRDTQKASMTGRQAPRTRNEGGDKSSGRSWITARPYQQTHKASLYSSQPLGTQSVPNTGFATTTVDSQQADGSLRSFHGDNSKRYLNGASNTWHHPAWLGAVQGDYRNPFVQPSAAEWAYADELRSFRAWEEHMRLLHQYAMRDGTTFNQSHHFDVRGSHPYGSRKPLPLPFQLQPGPRSSPCTLGIPRGLPPPSVESDHSRPRSAFLEEFRATHRGMRRWELRHIFGHVVEFCGDYWSSKFIQEKLEKAKTEIKDQIFDELQPDALALMKDPCGNYVLQKFFEHGTVVHKQVLLNQMKGQVPELSKHTYGCRVVQSAIENSLVDQKAALIRELDSAQSVMECVKNENGNHVIQVAVRVIPIDHVQFMVDVFFGHLDYLATHRYGCRVVQRLLEKVEAPSMISRMMLGLHACSARLIADQFGNYVPQHIMETGNPQDRDMIVNVVLQHVFSYSSQKFASNVVEKCVKYGNDQQRRRMMLELSADDGHGENKLFLLIRDSYGNYVIQSLLDHLNDADYQEFKIILEPQVTRALHMIPAAKTAENVARKMHRLPRARFDGPSFVWNGDSSSRWQHGRSYDRLRSEPPPLNTAADARSALSTPPLTVGGTDSPMSGESLPHGFISRAESRKASDEVSSYAGVSN